MNNLHLNGGTVSCKTENYHLCQLEPCVAVHCQYWWQVVKHQCHWCNIGSSHHRPFPDSGVKSGFLFTLAPEEGNQNGAHPSGPGLRHPQTHSLTVAHRQAVAHRQWLGRTLRGTHSLSPAGRRVSFQNTHIVGGWRSWRGRADVLWPHLQSPSIFHKEHFSCPLELRSLSSACSFNSLYLHYKQLSLVSWQEIQEVPKTHFKILAHSFPLCILNP